MTPGVTNKFRHYHDGLLHALAEEVRHSRLTRLSLDKIVSTVPGLITLFDQNLTAIYRNALTKEITGWTENDLLLINALTLVHPDDLEKVNDTYAMALSCAGVTHTMSVRLKHKDEYFISFDGFLTNVLHTETKALISHLLNNDCIR